MKATPRSLGEDSNDSGAGAENATMYAIINVDLGISTKFPSCRKIHGSHIETFFDLEIVSTKPEPTCRYETSQCKKPRRDCWAYDTILGDGT